MADPKTIAADDPELYGWLSSFLYAREGTAISSGEAAAEIISALRLPKGVEKTSAKVLPNPEALIEELLTR